MIKSFHHFENNNESKSNREVISYHPKFQNDYPNAAFIRRSQFKNHDFLDYFSEIIDDNPELQIEVIPTYGDTGLYMIEIKGKPIDNISSMESVMGCVNRLCEMENLSILSLVCPNQSKFFFVVGREKITESYQGISKHPKFLAEYDPDNFIPIRGDHKFNDYMLDISDQDPSLDIKIFKFIRHNVGDKERYLIQFFGYNVVKNPSPFEEGSNVPIIYDSINLLCGMENLSIEAIDFVHSSNKSSVLFLLKEDKIINESTTTKEDIKDYFVDFMDKFECTLTVNEDDFDRYEVCIVMDERYWRKHQHDVSANLQSCIHHLLDSTELERNGSYNTFERIGGRMIMVIKKRFKGIYSKDLMKMKYLKNF